jgi:hypothetical protein
VGGVSVGVLVGELTPLDYCTSILSHNIIEHTPNKSVTVEFFAVDSAFVKRSDVKIVAGWYTWLCADMTGSMLLGESGYNGLTKNLNIDLVKTYRNPGIVGKGTVVLIVDDVWTINIELSSPAGAVLSTASGEFKVFKRN